MYTMVKQWFRSATILGLAALPVAAQVGGPDGGAPPVEPPNERILTYSAYLAESVNGELAMQMVENVLRDGEVAGEYGQYLVHDDGSTLGVFQVAQVGPQLEKPAQVVLVRNPGGEFTIVGRQSLYKLPNGGKVEFDLVSQDYPDDVYTAVVKVDEAGDVVSASDNIEGLLADPTGTGFSCVIRCYVGFTFGYFVGPFLFWYWWPYSVWTPLGPFMWGYWTYLYYVKWFLFQACLATC